MPVCIVLNFVRRLDALTVVLHEAKFCLDMVVLVGTQRAALLFEEFQEPVLRGFLTAINDSRAIK